MNEIFDRAKEKECHSIFLEVRESNVAAVELYKSYGFVSTGKRKGYYSNPKEDALLMVKDI